MAATATQSPAVSAADPGSIRRAHIGVYVVLLAQLMLVLDSAVMNVALPRVQTALNFSPAGLSWVLNGYALAFGGLLLLGGRLGDVFGRRKVFMAGLATFTAASFIGGLAADPAMLIVSRALQGVGAAIAAPSVLALLATSAPNEAARNRALGLFTGVSAGGAGLGLILGGALTDTLSWRWTLFINVPIGIGVLLTVPGLVKETPRRPGRFDVLGALFASGAAVSLVWTLIKAPDRGWTDPATIGGFVIAAILVALLGVVESRHAHPLLRLGLLRSRSRIAALVAIAGLYGGMLSIFFLLVQYFEDVRGYSPFLAGIAFLPMPISIFTLSRITPKLVARYGQAPLMVLGALGATASFWRLTELHSGAGYWIDVFPALLGMAVGMGLSFMPITSLVLKDVEPEHTGSASGLLQTMQQLGGAVGLAVIASVYASHQVTGDFLHGARYAFTAAAILGGVALVSALSLVVSRQRSAEIRPA